MENRIVSNTLVTVLGDIEPSIDGIVDAHNHVWISRMPGVQPGSPFLDQYEPILQELKEYYAAGGRGIIDCQPTGCGRDGNKLAELSKLSRVHIICCTGFHRRCYYPSDSFIWQMDSESLATLFCQELKNNLMETAGNDKPVRAGFIKVAFESSLQETPQAQLEAAVISAKNCCAAIEAHTEKGADAENIIRYFLDAGLAANKIILCHIDKRPDFTLHKDLAKEGALLEYDTFFRPKYSPKTNLWPLLAKMIADGQEDSIALATDMAESNTWNSMGTGPGLIGLCNQVKSQLEVEPFSQQTIQKLLNTNILSRISRPK